MGRRQRRRRRRAQAPEDSHHHEGRTTRPSPRVRIRPDWHRPLGWLIVVLALVLAVVNDLAFIAVDLIPGGHNELYLVLALVVAGGGTWFLGLFDPPQ